MLLDREEASDVLSKKFPQINILTLPDIKEKATVALQKKYPLLSDAFRWSLKPVLLEKLIEDLGITEALYCDNDIFFSSNFDFLFSDLKQHDILLFPHWRINHPAIDKDWFETNFKDGIFNGGCIGVNKNAMDFLRWWADCCAYKCEVDFASGMYVDQKYLDIVPSIFPSSHAVQHKGCNVAYWNIRSLTRSAQNGKTLIDNKYEVVFTHFTEDYLRVLKNGEDPLMKPYADSYLQKLYDIKIAVNKYLFPAQ